MKYTKGITATCASILLLFNVVSADASIANNMEFVGEKVEYTIDKAVETALENSPEMIEIQLSLQIAEEDYGKNDRAIDKFRGPMKNEKGSSSYIEAITIPDLSNQFSLDKAKRNLDVVKNKLQSDIQTAYYSMQQAATLVDINKKNMDTSKDIHDKTKQKLELGLVSKQEVIKSELAYINATNQYEESIDNLKRAHMNLNTKMGNDVMDDLAVQGELEPSDYELGNIDDGIKSGMESRNEILGSKFQSEIQDMQWNISKAKYKEFTYQYKVADAEHQKVTMSYENTRKMIEMEIRSNYLDVKQKKKEIVANRKQVELAEEGLKLSQLSYDVGMSVLTDVQQAQNGLLQAELALSKSILDYNLAILKYKDSIGVGNTVIK